jgi:mycothiol synthase
MKTGILDLTEDLRGPMAVCAAALPCPALPCPALPCSAQSRAMNKNDKIAGLELRRFAGDEDFPAMAEVANAVFAADGMGWVREPEHIRRDYAGFTDFDPHRDIVMAQLRGELAGYVRTAHWTTEDDLLAQAQIGFVHPKFRRRGIGRLLLDWIERRQREIARAKGVAASVHHVFVTEGELGRVQMLRRAGYAPARHFFVMERPSLDQIPDFMLPAGFELRPVQPEHLRPIFDAHAEALRGHWGVTPPKPGDFERWTTLPSFQPQLWQVAWHRDSNQVAGQVKAWINAEQNATQNRLRGETEFISVGAPWRRLGLARALISRALHAQRSAGMTESMLGVDADNAYQAPRLYEGCGFRVVRRNAVYRKAVAPSRD